MGIRSYSASLMDSSPGWIPWKTTIRGLSGLILTAIMGNFSSSMLVNMRALSVVVPKI